MRQSTSALRDYLDGKNGNRQIKVKLVYPGGDEIRSVQTLDYDCSFGNSLALGNTVSANIRVTCETPAFDVSEREFTLFFGAKLPGDTDETWTQIGIFRTVPKSTETRMGFTTFTAYDRMYIKTNKQYNSRNTFPCKLSEILADACSMAEWTPAPAIAVDPTIENDYFSEYSIRDVIGYIASYQGKNAYADCDGNLTFKWFTSCDYTADGTKSNVPYADEKDTMINILVCSTGDENILAGSGSADTELLSFNNPAMTQERLEEIKDDIAGFRYRRLDADIPIGSYLIESGDIIKIKYENEAFNFDYTVPAMSVSYHYDGGLSSKISSYGVPDGITKSISARKFRDHTKFNELQNNIVDATNAITGATGGYVRINFGDDGKTAEIMILDKPEIDNPDPTKNAVNVWRWNQAGLAHSHSGYNGPFDDVAITAKGEIMAQYIAGEEIAGVNFRTVSNDSRLLLKDGFIDFLKGAEGDGRVGSLSKVNAQGGREHVSFFISNDSALDMRKNVGGGRPDEIEFEYTPSGGAYGVSKFEFINSKVYVPAYDDTLSFNGVYELSMEIYNLRKRIEGFENLFRLVTREE